MVGYIPNERKETKEERKIPYDNMEEWEVIRTYIQNHRGIRKDMKIKILRKVWQGMKAAAVQNDMAWTIQVWQNENYMGREEWMQQICEIHSDLAKGIAGLYHGLQRID